MAKLQFFGGPEIESADFSLALSSRTVGLGEFTGAGASLQLKAVFDRQRVGVAGRPQYPQTDTASLMSWHRRNELVYACIEKIAQAALDPVPVIQQQKAGKWAPVEGHPLKRLLMKPNPSDDFASFMAAWLTSEHVAGVFYAEIVRSPQDTPVALYPLDPSKMFPVAGDGKNGSEIAAYEWRDGAQKIRLKPEQVFVRRNRDLTTPYHGLSPLAVALGAVDSDAAQTDYVRAFFNNGGVPSGILTFKNRTLTRAEMEQKRQAWNLRYGRAGLGARGVAVLDQNAEYQKIGAALGELEADSLRGHAESRICMVFGVPPLLVGAYVGMLHVNQRASAREAQNDFWINKMSPTFTALRHFLTWNLLTEFVSREAVASEEWRVFWDMEHVLGLQEDADKRHNRAGDAFKSGLLTQNEARELIGVEPTTEGDFFLVPTTMNPRTGDVLLGIAKKPPQPAPTSGASTTTDPNAEGGDVSQTAAFDFTTLEAKGAQLFLAPAATEEKTFMLDGLELARAPRGVELAIDLKAVALAPDAPAGGLKTALLDLRRKLIVQAVADLSERDPADLHSVVLTPAPKIYKSVRRELDAAYKRGRALVAQERAAQLTGKAAASSDAGATDGEDDSTLDAMTGTTVSRVVSDVQSKAAAILATLAMLRVTGADRASRIKTTLEEGSTAYVEQAAKSASNAAVSLGRYAEMRARAGEIDHYVYSAILDLRTTCEVCLKADGMESESIDELPTAPNDECEGGDRCRCMIIAVFAGEAA